MGDPPRKLIKRQLRHLIQPRAKVRYLPLYAIDASTQAMRERFLGKVERAMVAF
jgi:hypothetical protein